MREWFESQDLRKLASESALISDQRCRWKRAMHEKLQPPLTSEVEVQLFRISNPILFTSSG